MQLHLVVSTSGYAVLSLEQVTNEICKALVSFLTIFSFSLSSHHPFFAFLFCFMLWFWLWLFLSCSPSPPLFIPSIFASHHCHFHFTHTSSLAWQGTDLMHNHVLADDDQSSLDSLGRRSSLSRLEPSDLSEDSDYDSIWTAHSYRMGSTSRKSCCSYISHQN